MAFFTAKVIQGADESENTQRDLDGVFWLCDGQNPLVEEFSSAQGVDCQIVLCTRAQGNGGAEKVRVRMIPTGLSEEKLGGIRGLTYEFNNDNEPKAKEAALCMKVSGMVDAAKLTNDAKANAKLYESAFEELFPELLDGKKYAANDVSARKFRLNVRLKVVNKGEKTYYNPIFSAASDLPF